MTMLDRCPCVESVGGEPTAQTTHAEGCWAWGPQHHACAVREIERIRARVAELERDLDACRVDHAEAYEQGRRDALREAIDLCQRTEAGDTNHDWREAAKCCRELIESLAAKAAEEEEAGNN